MTGHGKIRLMLYDYLLEKLDERDAGFVTDHLLGCERCSNEADEMRGLLKNFPPPAHRPSEALPDSYWQKFTAGVERRISSHGAQARLGIPDRALSAFRTVGDMIAFRKPLAIGGFAATVIAAFLLVVFLTGRDGERSSVVGPGMAENNQSTHTTIPDGEATVSEAHTLDRDSVTEFDLRVGNYFRRSKTLLVGMSNAMPADGDEFSLDAEKIASRRLVNEARYLRTGPVDERSWRLMEDLDEIMIELSNLDEQAGRSSAGMLRDGIKNRNLLFKLRMRETQSAGTPVQQAVYRK